VDVSISEGHVIAFVEASDDVDVALLRNLVRYQVSSVVDAFGLCEGPGLAVELDWVIESGSRSVAPLSGEYPGARAAAAERTLRIEQVLEAAGKSAILTSALRNLRLAKREPEDLYFFSFRAVETIRFHWEKPIGDSKKKQWDEMERSLNFDKSVTDWLRKHGADDQRHGRWANATNLDSEKAVGLASEVVFRFVLFLLDQEGFLPSDLPTLQVKDS